MLCCSFCYQLNSSSSSASVSGPLFPVKNDHGQIYFPFIEVCEKLFPDIPRQTIKSRLRNLGLTLVQCPAGIRNRVRVARPHLASFKKLSLISKRDVSVLEAYHESRMQNVTQLSDDLGAGQSASSNVESVFSCETRRNPPAFGSVDNQTSAKAKAASNFSISHILQGSETPTQSCAAQETTQKARRPSEDDCSDASSQSSDENLSGFESGDGEPSLRQQDNCEIVQLLKKRKLNPSAFQGVLAAVQEMKTFYLAEFNHKRRSPKMTESTWNKHAEQIITFLSYCATDLNLEASLFLVDDLPLVEAFVNHLKQNRSVQNSTAARYLHSLLIIAKFIHAEEGRGDFENVPSVSDIRSLRNQLEKAHRLTKGAPSVKLLWPQYQEVVRTLHCKYEDRSGAPKARLHMNFTMLLLFAVNPGRAKELRTLRMLKEDVLRPNGIDEFVKRWPEGDNVIIFTSEGTVFLIEHGFKTSSKYGPNVVRFDTTEYHFVVYHLSEYKRVSRPRLLSDDEHDFFFVNKRGTQFKSSGSFSNYISQIFQEHLGFPCAINEMRHALVENFRSSPESYDVRLAESLARVCKHSLRTQINIYDRRTESERRSQAMSYLNRSAVNYILDEPPSAPGEESEPDDEDLPSPGEMCALLASDSSLKSPKIFLARVLKYSADGNKARLAWFKEIETRPNHFKFQAGTDVWEERKSALIYPVDVIFHRIDGTYELRTPKERIYTLVRK